MMSKQFGFLGWLAAAVVALWLVWEFFVPWVANRSSVFGAPIVHLLIVVVALFVILLWIIPKFQVARLRNIQEGERFKLENDARTTLAQILGGTFLLVGLLGTWTTIRDSERGQFTERFTKAVAQIGDQQLDVRLGGIFALEALARESPQDRGSVVQVLAAFVRTHAPITETTGSKECRETTIALTRKGPLHVTSDAAAVEWPPMDVQTVLTILGRREIDPRGLGRLDLQNSDLECAYLEDADLSEANLQNSHLEGAWLSGTTFDRAMLFGTVANKAVLDEKTTFLHANLTGAKFQGAFNVKCYNLSQADDFAGAELPANCIDAKRKQDAEERSMRQSTTSP